jgi:hypothetical protein
VQVGKSRKIFTGAVIGIVTVVILLFAAVLLLPKLIESETLKAKIRSEFSQKVGGEIDFERLNVSFFPFPHVKLDKASVMLPKKLVGSAEMISVYPKILLLLSGKIGFREIRVQQPDVTITLQKSSEEEKPPAKPLAVGDLMRQIVSVLSEHSALQLPDVDGYVENGRFKLTYDNRAAVELDHIDARLTNAAGSLTFQVTGTSTAAESVSISGAADPRESKGSARIQLTRLQPTVIRDSFFPEFSLKMEAAPVDLTLNVNMGGPGQMQADIDVSIPELALARENKIVEMRNRELKGRVDLDKNSAAVSVTDLVLDYPQMSVAGHLASSLDDAQLRMEMEGRNIDVEATRQAALSLAGENDVIRGIFEVLKGGTVPQITLTAQGQTLSDLGNMDTLVIRGQMRDGNISIPGLQLDLTDTAGDVVISNGILNGENLRARLGNSTGQNGKLKLGLIGDGAPFHLDIDVRADLARLPPILDRLIDDKDFRSELAKIEDLNGNADGKLVLGEDLNNVDVTVAASDIHLTARYRGIPHPVAITGGNFSYTGAGIGVSQLSGSLGKSTFTDLSGGLEWGKKSELEISSARCDPLFGRDRSLAGIFRSAARRINLLRRREGGHRHFCAKAQRPLANAPEMAVLCDRRSRRPGAGELARASGSDQNWLRKIQGRSRRVRLHRRPIQHPECGPQDFRHAQALSKRTRQRCQPDPGGPPGPPIHRVVIACSRGAVLAENPAADPVAI